MFPAVGNAKEWTIPLAGNAYRISPEPGNEGFTRTGAVTLSQPDDVISAFVHINEPAALDLSINASIPSDSSTLVAKVEYQVFTCQVEKPKPTKIALGKTIVQPAGYVRIDLSGMERSGATYGQIMSLNISSTSKTLELQYVRSNEGNMFYWGRRGPSVHLRYVVPPKPSLRYAYSEITVPENRDPLGTFYMANGFGEGYFGMQVNGATERRVLFSVWSPFQTNNPRDIPEEQRIVAIAKGPGVRIGEFGNEGSGGQSFLVYPWQAGRTYRFLTEVIPDGNGNTTYTSWFGDVAKDQWRLIASFRRPKTDTHLRGFHSFLESFYPTHGHLERQGNYGNVWVGDVAGTWHRCVHAAFSVDATGQGQHRLDYAGGSDGESFFLKNCGFFNETGTPGEKFSLNTVSRKPPAIDLESLPRE